MSGDPITVLVVDDEPSIRLLCRVNLELDGKQGIHTLVFDKGKVPGFQLEVEGTSVDAKKIDLEPGKYVFYCDIPGHRAQGMEGTLTVK